MTVPAGMALPMSSPEEDEDQLQSDLEVASVLSKGVRHPSGDLTSPGKRMVSSTPGKYNYSPFRPSTVMTNVSRGNTLTLTPSVTTTSLTSIQQMAAQGELILLQQELQVEDINCRDDHGLSPLIWAAANNQTETVQFLLEHGADPTISGNAGETALHLTSAEGHDRVLNFILESPVDIDQPCKNGNTALLYAAYNNQVDCIKSLLRQGADMTIANSDGHTPLDITVTLGYKQAQRVIESHLLNLLDPT